MNPVDPNTPNNTRATQARQRKTQQSNTRGSTIAQRAVSEPAPAARRTVTSRNPTYGTPMRDRVATSNPRRQFYVALDTPGVEMRLPAMPMLHFGSRGASAAVAIACLVGILAMWLSPFFAVTTPRISGLDRLSEAEVESALNIQDAALITLNSDTLRDALLQTYPILESVRISISLPNQVSVTVKERQPIFAWNYGDKALWADASGVLFPATGAPAQMLTIASNTKPPLYVSAEEQKVIDDAKKAAAAAGTTSNAPTIAEITLKNRSQKGKSDKIDPGLFSAAQKLSTYFPAGMVLAYSTDHGLGWQDPAGWEVYVGKDLNNFDQKYALYQSISQQLAGQSITPAIISVEFLDAPYFRLEK